MTRVFFDGRDLEISIRRDGDEHVYPLVSLAAALRIEPVVLRARIDALLRAGHELSTSSSRPHHARVPIGCGIMEEEPTEVVVQRPTITTHQEDLNPDHHHQPSIPWSDVREASPEEIAEALGPEANSAAIATLIRGRSPSLVVNALGQALAVPGVKLRSNRAALFTAIVRRMTRSSPSSPSTPYARTPTSPT